MGTYEDKCETKYETVCEEAAAPSYGFAARQGEYGAPQAAPEGYGAPAAPKCTQQEKQECTKVPRQQCQQVPKQEAKEECTNVPKQVEKQECRQIPQQKCQQVPKQIPKQVP